MCSSLGRLLIVLLVVFVVGCGGDARMQKTYSVRGRVLLDSKPFKGAFVALIPKDTSKFVMNERPQATTDENGNFVLSTYLTGDGAPAGEYWVGIDSPNAPAEDDGSDQAVRKKKGAPSIPTKYNVAQKSGIQVTVVAGNNDLPPFELTTGK